MQEEVEIIAIVPDSRLLDGLAEEAEEFGFTFVSRSIAEAKSGANWFDQPGECFLGAFINGQLIGCGGLNNDPYTDQIVGRLRHIYVLNNFRRKGVARQIVQRLLDGSKGRFDVVRLRTPNSTADRFYEALGFQRTSDEHATHMIKT